MDAGRKATAAGADACLTKPFNLDELASLVEELAKRGRASQPALSGLTVRDAIKTYSAGMLGWARGNA